MDEMLGCLTWLALLWDQMSHFVTFQGCFKYFGSENRIARLSDEIIVDVLSRVPATSVLACRAVCSSWNRLTSTTEFPKMHLNNQVTPVIFGQVIESIDVPKAGFFIDDLRRYARYKRVEFTGLETLSQRSHETRLQASCNGLLVFGNRFNHHVIWNPVTQEERTLRFNVGDEICGFFFHDSDGEYKLLICHKSGENRYSLYGLSTKDWRALGKPISYYLHQVVGVLTNGALFWAVRGHTCSNGISMDCHQIVMFDTETETFVLKPQPADIYKCEARTQVKLLEIEGNLGCCDVYARKIEVWILEDIGSWRWVKKYVVDLNHHINKDDSDREKRDANTTVVGFQNGNLLLFRTYVGLLWCNLRLNVVRKIETSDIRDLYLNKRVSVNAVQYTSSLVSLRNCNILPS